MDDKEIRRKRVQINRETTDIYSKGEMPFKRKEIVDAMKTLQPTLKDA